MRLATKDHSIIQVLVRVDFFEKSLDGNDIANKIVSYLSCKLGLCLKDWLVSIHDRFKTNYKALYLISEKTFDDIPSRADCTFHTLNNTSQELIAPENNRAPHGSFFGKKIKP